MFKTPDPLFDNFAHLKTFPDSTLRDLAINDCAQHAYRKSAVEVLFHRKSPYLKHPELRPLLAELEIELDGIEFAKPEPSKPMTAGVTTATVFGGEVVDMEVIRNAEMAPKFTGFDDVQIRKPRPTRKVTSIEEISVPIYMPPKKETDAP